MNKINGGTNLVQVSWSLRQVLQVVLGVLLFASPTHVIMYCSSFTTMCICPVMSLVPPLHFISPLTRCPLKQMHDLQLSSGMVNSFKCLALIYPMRVLLSSCPSCSSPIVSDHDLFLSFVLSLVLPEPSILFPKRLVSGHRSSRQVYQWPFLFVSFWAIAGNGVTIFHAILSLLAHPIMN